MGRPAVVKVDIITDAKGVGPGVSEAESKLSRFGAKASKIGKVAAVGIAGIGLAAVGIGAKLIGAAEAGQVADRRLSQVNRSMNLFGATTDKVSKRLIDYAESEARRIGVDEDVIKVTQAKLLTFKEVGKTADKLGGIFDRATGAASDMAAAGFGTAETNAVQLGKALNDPIKGITALSRSGITFTATEKARIRTLVESNQIGKAQQLILGAIEQQVGGTAAATATMSDKMKVGFGQATEALGAKLLPAFNAVGNFILTKAMPAASKLGAELGQKLGPTIAKVGAFVSDRLVPAGRALYSWFVEKIAPGIVRYVSPILKGVGELFAKIGAKVEENHESLAKLGNVLAKVAEFIANKVYPVLGKLLGGAFSALGTGIGLAIDIVSTFIDIISTAVGWVEKLADKLGKVGGAIGKVGGLVGKLNPFAADDVFAPHAALTLIGSTVSPIRTGAITTGSLGDTALGGLVGRGANGGVVVIDRREFVTEINVPGLVHDGPALARVIDRLLTEQAIRLGRVTTLGGTRA